MLKNEAYLVLRYNCVSDSAVVKLTNLHPERIESFLLAYLMSDIKKDGQDYKPKQRDEYTIRIGCRLPSERFTMTPRFGTVSSLRNESVAAGVIQHCLDNNLILECVQNKPICKTTPIKEKRPMRLLLKKLCSLL